jgi:hypothetical protein
MTPKEFAQDFFSMSPRYRTKVRLAELIADATRQATIGEMITFLVPVIQPIEARATRRGYYAGLLAGIEAAASYLEPFDPKYAAAIRLHSLREKP